MTEALNVTTRKDSSGRWKELRQNLKRFIELMDYDTLDYSLERYRYLENRINLLENRIVVLEDSQR